MIYLVLSFLRREKIIDWSRRRPTVKINYLIRNYSSHLNRAIVTTKFSDEFVLSSTKLEANLEASSLEWWINNCAVMQQSCDLFWDTREITAILHSTTNDAIYHVYAFVRNSILGRYNKTYGLGQSKRRQQIAINKSGPILKGDKFLYKIIAKSNPSMNRFHKLQVLILYMKR